MIIWTITLSIICGIFGIRDLVIACVDRKRSNSIRAFIWITCAFALTNVSTIIEYKQVKQGPIEFFGTVIKKENNEDGSKNIVVESKEGEQIIVNEMFPKTTEDIELCVVGDKVKMKYVELKGVDLAYLHWEPENAIIVTDFQIE